jgi:acyl-CoA synthetase (AMP-forming)/AMP-acid ligase II
MTIPGIFEEMAARWPQREALIATRGGRDVAVTFAALKAASDAFAEELAGHGIGRGSPVLVFVPMSIALYVALLGLFRVGATAVFVDPSSGLGHINACCKTLPPAALISVMALRLLRPFVSGLRTIPQVFSPPGILQKAGRTLSIELPLPDDPALIILPGIINSEFRMSESFQ